MAFKIVKPKSIFSDVKVSLGTHILVDFYDCHNHHLLKDPHKMEMYLIESAKQAGATVISSTTRTFEPYGVTSLIILAESHISVHTFPEFKFASFDFFTCGETANPYLAFKYCKEIFLPDKIVENTHLRGEIKYIKEFNNNDT